ncbi:MAG TPA: hypothetical protein VMR62_39500 [Bryobacteraceae bacterium]|jgi:hypothetical protein|nr:hypothetical protein [Bryobacteraceae bacterium]
MKLVAVFVFLACCAFGEDRAVSPNVESAACGPRDMKLAVKIDQSQHPTPAPPEGKALVYVVDQEIHDNIGVDGKWAGANDRGTYFFVAVDPGEHHLCAYATFWGASWLSLHSLQAKAGETYYFLPIPIGNGGRGGRYALEQLDPDEGKYLVSKARFATSQPR